MVKHTLILKEGIWVVKGSYFDEEGNKADLRGEVKVEHADKLWTETSEMVLRVENKPVEIKNKYLIQPFMADGKHTTWIAEHPILGKLLGKMVVNDDAIVATFISEDKQFTGSEFYIKFTDTYYLNKGFSFGQHKKLSSWTLDFRKKMT
ncbi:hypothetical protein HOC37_07985 [bacterium]|jgi:hypothetical protein|nr:hypothetical protein [bacterium]MBT4552898.1 hypothetical protein [bacterium]